MSLPGNSNTKEQYVYSQWVKTSMELDFLFFKELFIVKLAWFKKVPFPNQKFLKFYV